MFWEKTLGKTTHETMFWEKTLEKLRTKRCFGKKPWKNYARNDVREKSLGKTTRETMFGEKALEKLCAKGWFEKKYPEKRKRRAVLSPQEAFSQRSNSAPPIRIPSMMREANRG